MLAYIAVALVDAGVPSSKVHEITYDSLSLLPQNVRDELTNDGGYRSRVAHDPGRFVDQLPFYSVKPLYPWLISVLYRAGVALPKATVIISSASYAIVLILLFFWFSRLASPLFASVFASTLALTPFLSQMAQLSTPDILSLLIVLFGLYLSLELQRHYASVAILIASILARPENLIYAAGFLAYLALARKLHLRVVALSVIVAIALFVVLTRASGSYGYQTLFYYTFVNYDIDVKSFVSPLELRQYASIYLHGIDNMLFNQRYYFGFFASLAAGAFGMTAVTRGWSDKYFHMILLAGIFAAARFALLPYDFHRAFLVPYMTVLIAFVAMCCSITFRAALSPRR